MKIAVVSTDSVEVDDWFSNATRFLIYEIDQDGATFIAERDSEPLPADFFDAGMLNSVVDVISDCDMVYLANIKEKPAKALKKRGILPVVYAGPIIGIDSFSSPEGAR